MLDPLRSTAPASPCINVCLLDDQGYCRGCLRTVDEITRWTTLSADQQWIVVRACQARRAQLPAHG